MAAIRILEPSGSDGSLQIQKGGEFDHSEDLFFDILPFLIIVCVFSSNCSS